MKNIMEFNGGYKAVIAYDPGIEMFRGDFLNLISRAKNVLHRPPWRQQRPGAFLDELKRRDCTHKKGVLRRVFNSLDACPLPSVAKLPNTASHGVSPSPPCLGGDRALSSNGAKHSTVAVKTLSTAFLRRKYPRRHQLSGSTVFAMAPEDKFAILPR